MTRYGIKSIESMTITTKNKDGIDNILIIKPVPCNMDGQFNIVEIEEQEIRKGNDIWILSRDVSYYPFIQKYKTEAEAVSRYNEIVKELDSDECVFISKVSDYACGDEYELDYEEQ